MIITFYPIYGLSLGFQVTGGNTEDGQAVNVLLLDILLFTLQFAWISQKELP